MIKKILLKLLRYFRLGFIFQRKDSSFKNHESTNYSKDIVTSDVNTIKRKHNYILDNFKKKYSKLLTSHLNENKKNVLIDIGAGQLLHTNYFSKFFKHIFSVEPSLSATQLGQKIYNIKASKVTIINSFIEDLLKEDFFIEANYYYTGHVLSHLTEESFEVICNCLNNESKINSVIIFDELWTNDNEIRDNMFYVRSKKKWQNYLSKWELTFINDNVKVGNQSFYKGLVGKKIY
jgi:hypothetical protein